MDGASGFLTITSRGYKTHTTNCHRAIQLVQQQPNPWKHSALKSNTKLLCDSMGRYYRNDPCKYITSINQSVIKFTYPAFRNWLLLWFAIDFEIPQLISTRTRCKSLLINKSWGSVCHCRSTLWYTWKHYNNLQLCYPLQQGKLFLYRFLVVHSCAFQSFAMA